MYWIGLFLVLLVTYLVVNYMSSRRNVPLPPGPLAYPLVGNLLSIPASSQDMHFYRLGLRYGEIVHLKLLGQSLVVLNSVQAAVELLDKRGANYSDRPDFPIYDILQLTNTLALLKYGNEFRKQRAMVQKYFSKERSREYRPVQTREARILAMNLLSTTENKLDAFLRFATAIIIDISYGHQIQSNDDPYLKLAREVSHAGATSGPPGGTPVDLFPFLRHFPSWFPGTYYATYARTTLPTVLKFFQYPYDHMKQKMANGTAKPSFLASLMEDMLREGDENEATVKRIQAATAITYIAGAETTASTLSFFLLAMVLHPEVQVKAQKEIDRVVGSSRLPEFEDRESLPYNECVLQETLRWNQTIPVGIPHKSMEDDIYNGMLIPKGSIIIANARAMTLDDSLYKDPFKFNPSRFLPPPEGLGEPYPAGQFGFGRRICPGRFLGENSIWIAMVTILATKTISRVVGEDGKEIVPQGSTETTGIANHPSPFPCDVKPRNEEMSQLLRRAVESG